MIFMMVILMMPAKELVMVLTMVLTMVLMMVLLLVLLRPLQALSQLSLPLVRLHWHPQTSTAALSMALP